MSIMNDTDHTFDPRHLRAITKQVRKFIETRYGKEAHLTLSSKVMCDIVMARVAYVGMSQESTDGARVRAFMAALYGACLTEMGLSDE